MDRHKTALELAKFWTELETDKLNPAQADAYTLAAALLDYAKRLEEAEEDRRILSRKKVEGNKQLERIFERVVGTIADRTYHRQCTYQEYRDLKASVAELEAEVARVRTDYEIIESANRGITMPCGHNSRFAYTEDGGKHIVCLLCKYAELAQATSIGTQYERFEDAGNGDTRCQWCSAYIGHDKGCPGDMFSTPKEALRFVVSAHDRLAYQLARKDAALVDIWKGAGCRSRKRIKEIAREAMGEKK